jgi:hypothetical protein
MKKIALIAGCSHSAGSEIDGTEDSRYNREHSFGSLLAKQLGYEPINIAINGATNSGIARSILLWFEEHYDPTKMEVFVCVGWTESSRLEVPARNRPCYYNDGNASAPWFDSSTNSFFKINFGWEGGNEEERIMIPPYHKFMAENLDMLETWAAKDVLMIEYFLKSKSIPYVMTSTMHMFTPDDPFTRYLVDLVDDTRYFNIKTTQDEAFFWKYRNLGYINEKAKYWHHGEEPHRLYAEELYKFVKEKQNV